MKRPAWRLPAPQDGVTYTYAEVAAMTGVTKATVQSWIHHGVQVGRERVRLSKLHVPRARILPGDLASFLSSVNGVDVGVEGTPSLQPMRRQADAHSRAD